MKRVIGVAAVFFFAAGTFADSLVHYVSTSGASVPPYTNWTDAAISIQDALDAAADGDTILVGDGTYALTSEITVSKAVVIKSLNGPDSTVVSGQTACRCFNLGSSVCTVSGFAIRYGYAELGGGVYCDDRTPVVTNCTIQLNSAEIGAGSCYGTLIDCLLQENFADYSGGGNAFGTLSGCTIRWNTTGNEGGGCYGSTGTNCTLLDNTAEYGGGCNNSSLYNCTLSFNTAEYGGGSFNSSLYQCILTNNIAHIQGGGSQQDGLRNCVLSENFAAYDGGGCFDSSLKNCTLTGNRAGNSGGGCYEGGLENCIIWSNQADASDDNWVVSYSSQISYSCTTPDPGGTGNITNDPQFVQSASGDFRLKYGSPCIDTGENIIYITIDLDGNPRPVDGSFDSVAAFDMGAYEYTPSLYDTDDDGLTDSTEIEHQADPLDSDSDDDGRTDGNEVDRGWSPVFDESVVFADGQAAVTENPSAFGLYTSDSITDLDMGRVMLQTSNGMMRMSLQLEQCTDLADGSWTNVGDSVLWEVEAPDGKAFYRIKGAE